MDARWIDISHEALIRGWPRLRKWIDEDRAGLRAHRRITDAAQEWEKAHRDESTLFRGTRLAQATEWRERHEGTLNDSERAFLDASTVLQQREFRERERLRRRVITGLLLAFAVTLALAGFAAWQWRAAYVQGQIALARQLVAEGNLQGNKSDTLVLRTQLAAEALRRLADVGARSLEVDTAVRQHLARFPRHVATFDVGAQADEVALSSDGRFLTAGYFRAELVRIWEIRSRKLLLDVKKDGTFLTGKVGDRDVSFEIPGGGHFCAVTPDGTLVATLSDISPPITVQVWNLPGQSSKLKSTLAASYGQCLLSPDGSYLAVSGETFDDVTRKSTGYLIEVWDVRAERKLDELHSAARPAGFSPDSSLLLTHRGAWQIEPAAARPLAKLSEWRDSFRIFMSPDSRYLAKSEEDSTGVWSLADRRNFTKVHDFEPKVSDFLALSEDGRRLVDSGDDDASVLELPGHPIAHAGFAPRTAVFLPEGSARIATVDGQTVTVWDLVRGGSDFRHFDHDREVTAAAFAADGSVVTVGEADGACTVRSWSVESGKENPAIVVDGETATLSANGKYVAVAGKNAVRVWQVGQRRPIATFPFGGTEHALALSEDGRFLAAGSEGSVRVWDVIDEKRQGEDLTYTDKVWSMAISPDGTSVAAVLAAGEGTRRGVRLSVGSWNLASATPKWEFGHGETYCFLRPDAKQIVTALGTKDVASGAVVGAGAGSETCALSADGNYLASKTEFGVSIALVSNGKEVTRLETPDSAVSRIFFAPDNRYLGTVDARSTVSVWMLREGELLAETCTRLPANLPDRKWSDFLGSARYRKTCPNLP